MGVRVLIADDDPDFLALLRTLIELADGLAVAGEAVDGVDAVTQWRARRPDVVVLDYRMPQATGLEEAERILAEEPNQVVFMLSGTLDPMTERAAERLGVRACVSKRDVRYLIERLRASTG